MVEKTPINIINKMKFNIKNSFLNIFILFQLSINTIIINKLLKNMNHKDIPSNDNISFPQLFEVKVSDQLILIKFW